MRASSALAVLAAVHVATVTAHAQTASSEAQDIVVTANKREQSINDVGLSVVALSGDDLVKRGVINPADLAKVVPGFTFAETTNGTPVYTLRGVGFYDTSFASSPTVSMYTDELPLPFPVMTRGATLDLERVEVLKGPQGTLFGQNSTGGAINLIAAKPTDHASYGGSLEYGRFNTLDATAFVSAPLADTLSFRAAAAITRRFDGWQKSDTRDDTLGKQDMLKGRLLLKWEPSSQVTFNLNLNGWRDKSDTQAAQLQELLPQAPDTVPPALLLAPVARDNARSADWSPDFDYDRNDSFYQIGLRGDYEISDAFKITALASYNKYKADSYYDSDGVALHNLDYHPFGHIKSYNAELRASGKSGRLSYIAGLNYAKDSVNEFFRTFIADGSTSQTFGIPFDSVNVISQTRAKSYAAFGSVAMEATDRLSFDVGARYTKNKRQGVNCAQDGGNGGLAQIFTILESVVQTGAPGSPTITPLQTFQCLTLDAQGRSGFVVADLDQDNVSWRAGVNYKLGRSSLIYASVSRGYKNGGFPAIPGGFAAQFIPVTQEALTAYEAGFKLRIADGLGQLNGSVFHYSYRDKQLLGKFIDPIFGALQALQNIPRSRVNGAELELNVRPVENLKLSGSITYLDAKITDFTGIDGLGNPTADLSGTKFPYTPKITAAADAEYTGRASDALDWFVGAGLTYNSSTNAGIGNPEQLRIAPYALLDLRAGVRSSDGRWTVSVFGRNVTDKYYWNTVQKPQDTIVRYAGMPATYGVNVRFVVP